MYVRNAKNRDEAWLLDRLEELPIDDPAFRSRDYVIAVDETSNTRAGFGRIRVHKAEDQAACELTAIGVVPGWRSQGVGAHIIERLLALATDAGFETVYAFSDIPDYFTQFGFRPASRSALPDVLMERYQTLLAQSESTVPVTIAVDSFEMPSQLRERFKSAAPDADEAAAGTTASPEDFGIDPDKTTHKYDL